MPNSLETAVKFAAVRGPHHFFPPMGMLVIVSAISAIFFSWRNKSVRNLFISSFLLVIIFEFLASAFFFWGRNMILFDEGLKVHSAEYLLKTAKEFQAGHWVRLVASGFASMLAFVGLHKFYRQ